MNNVMVFFILVPVTFGLKLAMTGKTDPGTSTFQILMYYYVSIELYVINENFTRLVSCNDLTNAMTNTAVMATWVMTIAPPFLRKSGAKVNMFWCGIHTMVH
jgi:hypothetical protein